MEKATIDTRGLSCPEPVVIVNQALKKNYKELEILIDSSAAKENIGRLLKKFNINFSEKLENDIIIYTISM